MPEFKVNNLIVKDELPVIALRDIAMFPHLIVPLAIGRPKTVAALDQAMATDKLAVFVAQKDSAEEIRPEGLYSVGTIGRINLVFRMSQGSASVQVEAIKKVKILNYSKTEPYLAAKIEPVKNQKISDAQVEAMKRTVIEQLNRVVSLGRPFPSDFFSLIKELDEPEKVSYLVAYHLNLGVKDQQKLLEISDTAELLREVNKHLLREIEILETEKKLAKETRKQLGKMQKEVYLREQLRSIEKELGLASEKSEFSVLRKKIKEAKMPGEIEAKALKELERLEKMPSFSPEVSYIRTYLDWLIELPWSRISKRKIDIKKAAKILDEDHFGLEKVKERILEYLAVQKQVGKIKGPILCFVGPPGTGKTSIGQSIARAMGRKFFRMSLGGVRDEAEIRGHRRTYVGSLPGRIIQGIHSVRVNNPVFMLDEIDKLGFDFRGDPSSALLEALDPEQNYAFSDHYLEIPFDLSNVIFITTANILDTIPPALRDRLEVIEFPGYTEHEKLHIAKGFLIPKLLKDHGVQNLINFSDDGTAQIIRKYTREAGVRDLERQLAKIIRKNVRELVENGPGEGSRAARRGNRLVPGEGSDQAKVPPWDKRSCYPTRESPQKRNLRLDIKNKKSAVITLASLRKYLGPEKYLSQLAEKKDEVGVATGLAWTSAGGEVMSVEVTRMPGRGKLELTGHLGNVMRESAKAALSFARANASKVSPEMKKVNMKDFYKYDIHIHVPSGAIPKDGPSAGITIATALFSMFTGIKVRKDIAMTGEITLRGKVLEIGGIKEKVLAAHRAGIKTVILPQDSKKDLEDIPKEIRKELKFFFVENMKEVLDAALRWPKKSSEPKIEPGRYLAGSYA